MKGIILGVNAEQGLGGQLSKRFASEGLEMFIGGRTKTALDIIVKQIKKQIIVFGFSDHLSTKVYVPFGKQY